METFEELLNKHKRWIELKANSFGQDYQTVQDLEQVGRIGLWEAYKGYNSEKGSFKSYAIKIIINCMRTHLRNNSNTIRTGKTKDGFCEPLSTISLSTPINEEGDVLSDLISSEVYQPQNNLKFVKTALECVKKEKDKKILMMWLGFDEDFEEVDKMTYKQIGLYFGITKEAVRQIIEKQLNILRKNKDKLKELI